MVTLGSGGNSPGFQSNPFGAGDEHVPNTPDIHSAVGGSNTTDIHSAVGGQVSGHDVSELSLKEIYQRQQATPSSSTASKINSEERPVIENSGRALADSVSLPAVSKTHTAKPAAKTGFLATLARIGRAIADIFRTPVSKRLSKDKVIGMILDPAKLKGELEACKDRNGFAQVLAQTLQDLISESYSNSKGGTSQDSSAVVLNIPPAVYSLGLSLPDGAKLSLESFKSNMSQVADGLTNHLHTSFLPTGLSERRLQGQALNQLQEGKYQDVTSGDLQVLKNKAKPAYDDDLLQAATIAILTSYANTAIEKEAAEKEAAVQKKTSAKPSVGNLSNKYGPSGIVMGKSLVHHNESKSLS